MADSRGLTFYPRWVNKKTLIIGDVMHKRKSKKAPWVKFIYTAKKWLPYDLVPAQLKQKSHLRQQAQEHIRTAKETG